MLFCLSVYSVAAVESAASAPVMLLSCAIEAISNYSTTVVCMY